MLLKRILFFLLLLVPAVAAACTPAAPQVTPHLLDVHVTSAAYPRVSELFHCAPPSVVIRLSDPATAQLTVRLGAPDPLVTPAYEVGTEDILVFTHNQAGVSSLTLDQVQQVFGGIITNWQDVGGNDLPIQVWTYAAGEDIQQIFQRVVMSGQPVTSMARLAVSSQAMSDEVGNTPGSVGYLARRWKAGNTRDVLDFATVPVLAVARAEPDASVKALVDCLQRSK
jgi:hypothetical protein